MQYGQKNSSGLLSELPHVIVIILLVIVLLFVATKFGWMHCSQVPGWCNYYCKIEGSRTRVAVISDNTGFGDANAFVTLLSKQKPDFVPERFPAKELSFGQLKAYDLVIVEGLRNVTPSQLSAIRKFLDGGGNMILVGDSLVSRYLDSEDVYLIFTKLRMDPKYQDLREKFPWITSPNSQVYFNSENFKAFTDYIDSSTNVSKTDVAAIRDWARVSSVAGYYDLEPVLGSEYVDTLPQSTGKMKFSNVRHLLTNGLKNFNLTSSFSYVNPDSAAVTKLAYVEINGREYPALFERKYVGKILYLNFQPEKTDSPAFLSNLLDYFVVC